MKDYDEILSPEATEFLYSLHRKFNSIRLKLLDKRHERQKKLDEGVYPDFLTETENIRKDLSWSAAKTPKDLKRRWVEITGPTDRKMIINAMNSGADIFMADFEDANSPTWENIIEGQLNLKNTVEGTIHFEAVDGKNYALKKNPAVLLVRPRGWHLNEKHFLVDGEEISGSLFDFGLYLFHNGKQLLHKGSGPYFYLAKMESYLEARLWNDVFIFSEREIGIPQGSIRATVLIETILAAFEMEEILYELREYSTGLNAGRWDYIFSIIKKFQKDPHLHLPDRDQITMTVPFMKAYTRLLVNTCHKRGAHAIGGMAAFIPNRKDKDVTEHALNKVREDKLRETKEGFDGTWVAHPDLVPIARLIFEEALQGKKNQKEHPQNITQITTKDLIDFTIPGRTITENGLRNNINVAIQYLASWLIGKGAAAIYNLMEDAATAEISRAQVWQWIHNKEKLDDGRIISADWVETLIEEELQKIAALYKEHFNEKNFHLATSLFKQLVFAENFIEFLTLEAYKQLGDIHESS